MHLAPQRSLAPGAPAPTFGHWLPLKGCAISRQEYIHGDVDLHVSCSREWALVMNCDTILLSELALRKEKKAGMATTGLEPVTLALLAPRSNQLS